MKLAYCLFAVTLAQAGAAPKAVIESARRIPLAASVDVVVVGGSVAGVAAASEAAAKGKSVFLIAPRLYLGEDVVDTMHLWLEAGEKPTGPLTERIFSKPGPASTAACRNRRSKMRWSRPEFASCSAVTRQTCWWIQPGARLVS